jgi:hypothetical protein
MDVTGQAVQILQPPGIKVPVSGDFTFSSGTVTVDNTAANPIPVSGSFTFSSGTVTVANTSTNPVPVSGSFSFTSGEVTVTNTSPIPVSGTVTADLAADATVSLSAGTAAIGTAAISNFPATQTIAGTVTAELAAGSTVTAELPAGTTVSATVTFPTTQDVSGTVTAELAADATVALAAGTAAIGTAAIANFPSTQTIAGTVTADLAADATPGSAAPAVALFVAGTDGTDAHGLLTTASGQLIVAGQDTVGTGHALPVAGAGNAAPANGLAVGGSDGTDLRLLATDTAGHLQVASVSDPVTVTTGPHQIANIAAGTAVAAAGTLLTATYTAPADGTLNVTYALETATPVQVSYDGGTYYADLAAGSAAVANALYAYSQGIPSGAVVQFSVPTATTIGIFAAWFQATQ